ncbi:hypothetical protein ACFX2I_017049 [Malus domestica]
MGSIRRRRKFGLLLLLEDEEFGFAIAFLYTGWVCSVPYLKLKAVMWNLRCSKSFESYQTMLVHQFTRKGTKDLRSSYRPVFGKCRMT